MPALISKLISLWLSALMKDAIASENVRATGLPWFAAGYIGKAPSSSTRLHAILHICQKFLRNWT